MDSEPEIELVAPRPMRVACFSLQQNGSRYSVEEFG
jgi:hypothetical protein